MSDNNRFQRYIFSPNRRMAVPAATGFRDFRYEPGGRGGPTWPGSTLFRPAASRIGYILGRGVEFANAAVLEAGGSAHYRAAARFRPRWQPADNWRKPWRRY